MIIVKITIIITLELSNNNFKNISYKGKDEQVTTKNAEVKLVTRAAVLHQRAPKEGARSDL
jgi:hypothetical protein